MGDHLPKYKYSSTSLLRARFLRASLRGYRSMKINDASFVLSIAVGECVADWVDAMSRFGGGSDAQPQASLLATTRGDYDDCHLRCSKFRAILKQQNRWCIILAEH
jgi:hypothetical protein